MTNTTYLEAKRLSLYTLKLSSRQTKIQNDVLGEMAFLDIIKEDVEQNAQKYQKLYDTTKTKQESIHNTLEHVAQFLKTQEDRLKETDLLYQTLLASLEEFDQETKERYAHIKETLETRAKTYMANIEALKKRMFDIQTILKEDTTLTDLKEITMNYLNISSNLDTYLREHKSYLEAKQQLINDFDNHHGDWFTKGRELIKETNAFKVNMSNATNSINSIFLTVARQPSSQLSEERIDQELAALEALESGQEPPVQAPNQEPEQIVASTLAQLETNDQKSDKLESNPVPKKKGFFGRMFN